MSSATIGGIEVPITFTCVCNQENVLSARTFHEWCLKMSDRRFDVKSIEIQSVDMFGPRVGFIKLKADVERRECDDPSKKKIPAICFLRGGAAAILMKIRCRETGHLFTILTVQARVPVGDFEHLEIPAGMVDDSSFRGTAAKELDEEAGISLGPSQMVCLSDLAGHQQGMFPSSGGCDESIKIYLAQLEMSHSDIASLQGKLTGEIGSSESIRLKLIDFDDVCSVPDAKALSAKALHDYLSRQGKIPDEFHPYKLSE
jgi:8-oxo-dGTP pyrophosphatase MutT (NUDIX family)